MVSAIKAAAASVTVAVSATAAASMIVVASATAVALTTVVALAIVAASTTVAASATVVASVTAVVSITMLPATDLGALLQMGAQVGMKGHQVAASEEDKVEDQVGMALPEADTEQTSSAKAVLVGMTTEKPSVRAIRSPHRIPVVLRVRFNVYYMQRCKFQGLPRLFLLVCVSLLYTPPPPSHLRLHKKASIPHRRLFLHDGLFSNTCCDYITQK